ncbi:hypothetical protein ACWCPJ_10890 [Streptomyces collinus]
MTIIARQTQEGIAIRIEPVWTWKRWAQVAVLLAWGVVVGQFNGHGWWFFLSFLAMMVQLAYLPRTAPFRRVKPGTDD